LKNIAGKVALIKLPAPPPCPPDDTDESVRFDEFAPLPPPEPPDHKQTDIKRVLEFLVQVVVPGVE
jgi:hypothetical protein